MAKKKSGLIKLRQPKIRITPKGVKVTNVGATIGGKNARFNVSRQGVTASVGVSGARYNSRRGCVISPFTLLAGLFRRKR